MFSNISGVIQHVGHQAGDLTLSEGESMKGIYVSEGDQCILEDSSGRINLPDGPYFKTSE